MTSLTKMLAVTVVFAGPVFANTLVINDTDTQIRFPFGTDTTSPTNYLSGATYQQIYSSTEFPGAPILITELAFSTSSVISSASLDSLGLDVHLGDAATSAANPSATFSSNRGSDYQDVFSGMLTFTPAQNNTFDMVLHLTTPFLYNPSAGDLLLDILLTQTPSITGSALYFGGDSSATDARIFNASPSATGRVDFNTLATEFTFTSVSAAPEPSTLLMLVTGLGAVIVGLKRKRT